MRLLDHLPPFHAGSFETSAIQGALDGRLDELLSARDDGLLQLDLATATWGLSLWEEAYGIETDITRADEFRRSRVMSRMRGQGTTTAAMIQSVAESFANGAVEVEEQPGEHRFKLRFVGALGVPPNMDDLTAAIEEIKPAHLAFEHVFIYRTWREVRDKTWGEVSAFTWDQLRGGEID